jgi:DNA-binding NarL/FixJ family response regulator
VRVLIVDASARVRTRLAQRLTAAGVEVAEAADLNRALASVVSSDAVILDVHLDADTGISGLTRLRQSAPTALIVVLTNEVSEHHRRECVRYGADFFLDKSRDFDRAVELVRRAAKPRSR